MSFLCSGTVCGFQIHSLQFPLSCCSITFPSQLLQLWFSPSSHPCCQRGSRGVQDAGCCCCEGAAVYMFPTSLAVDAPSASHSKGSRQEYHGNQGAKGVSHRRSKGSPKPGAVHVPARRGIVAAGECPDRCPTGRTPRKLPKFGDRGQPPCNCHTDPLPGCNVPGK